jgi:hypothetical protein
VPSIPDFRRIGQAETLTSFEKLPSIIIDCRRDASCRCRNQGAEMIQSGMPLVAETTQFVGAEIDQRPAFITYQNDSWIAAIARCSWGSGGAAPLALDHLRNEYIAASWSVRGMRP